MVQFLIYSAIIVLSIIVILVIYLLLIIFDIPNYKLGIPVFYKDLYWTVYIYLNLDNLKKLNNKYFLLKKKNSYIIWFLYPWQFEIYDGKSIKEIENTYHLGGQSNKASYLTRYQRYIGKKIEKYYLKYLSDKSVVELRKLKLDKIKKKIIC